MIEDLSNVLDGSVPEVNVKREVRESSHFFDTVMVASYLSSSYLISASILSNLGAHLISHLIYGCGLVSSSRTFWYVPLHSDVIDDIT